MHPVSNGMKVKNFSEDLEKHLVRLGHDAAKLRELPENRQLPEREALKQSIKSLAQEENVPTAQEPSSVVSETKPRDNFLPAYLSGSSDDNAKSVVERLLEKAMNNDLIKAILEAKKYPPFIEDAFHDALVDKLLPELKKRGAIKS